MEEPNRSVPVVRFGVFEVDLRAGELRKNGLRIKLQEQPFQILAMLLERSGEVVTREELFQKLWSADTIVDFDHSLNAAIKKLRQALGDSADNPRFVETLARRGYRFIAPVDGGGLKEAALVVPIFEVRATLSEEEEKTRARAEKWWMNRWVGLAVGVVLCVGAAVWFQLFRPEQKATLPPPRVIPFTSFPGNEIFPAFSPDGKQLAYAWSGEKDDNFDIYVQLIGAGAPLRLTHHPHGDVCPAWSPDGRYIAFVRESEAGGGIFWVPALGGPERELVHLTKDIPQFAWSSDGKSLVIASKNSDKEPFSLFLLSIDTGERKRLTFPPSLSPGDTGPVVSPDGKTIAFSRHSNMEYGDVWILPLNGGEPKRLTFDHRAIIGLDWTPDGREIIFSTDFRALWRVETSGGKPQQVAGIREEVIHPSVSRQGNRLAYSSRFTQDLNIWRLDVPSSDHQAGPPLKLIASTRDDGLPQYSPDGKRIAFVSDRLGTNQMWVCDSEGQNAVQITPDGAFGPPSWSPDGQFIAFDGSPPAQGNYDIYIVSANGGVPRRFTTESSFEARPSWSHDGKWIYFASNRSGDWQVWKVPFAGGQAVQVTRKGGSVALESTDGKFLYYSKGLQEPDVPGLCKVPVEGGEEIPVIESLKAELAGYWAVVEKGIYFVEPTADSGKSKSTVPAVLKFKSFATGQINQVTPLEKPPIDWVPGLSVSPDGRWILYMQNDGSSGSDIMLMENFR